MDPFLGQIQAFGFNFAPRGWALCDGQLLPIASNTALFSLLGTTYGGDGRTTFALPDLRGRTGVHMGQGPGLTDRALGSKGGEEQVVLTEGQLPAHGHSLVAAAEAADQSKPSGNQLASGNFYHAATNDAKLAETSIGKTGSNQPHDNMPPYLTINWCIALVGVYPART